MKVILLSVLFGVVVSEAPIEFNYHESYGIPLAEKIRAAEKALDFDGARIVGGSPANLGSHPYMGGLLISLRSGATSVCGSSLVSNNRLVTAAHCWTDGWNIAFQLDVVLGSTTLFTGGTRITTNRIILHPNYSTSTYVNDIAIVTIDWVNYSNNIRNIVLPFGNLINDNFAGSWAIAAGFGRTGTNVAIPDNQILSEAWLQVITNSVCQQTYGGITVIATTLCTSGNAGRNICSGDSGGPLAIDAGGRVLIGVISFGHRSGCEGRPSGYARVSSFVPWIQSLL